VATGALVIPRSVPPWAPLLCLLACLGSVWVVVAPLGEPSLWGAVGAAVVVGGLGGTALSLARERRAAPILVMFTVLGLGLLRAGSVVAGVPERGANLPAERLRARATIDAPVETRGKTATVYARLEGILQPAGAEPLNGRIRAIVPALPPLEAGQPVEIAGRFESLMPTEARNGRLIRQGVIAETSFPQIIPLGPAEQNPLVAALRQFRSAIEATIREILPEPHAALLSGLLVGSAASMPESLRLALVGSGTSHLVVVSGYNITLVAAVLTAVFRSARILRLVPLIGVWAFTLVAGANPPALRAALMATAALIALGTGRGADALGALGLAAAALLLIDPLLIFDLGFQLSVLATLGLVTLQPRVAGLFGWLPSRLREPMAATLAAQLATAPLLAATFHQISVVAPVANLLAAPAIPVITIAGAVGVALTAAWPLLAAPLALLLFVPTSYLVTVFEWSARLPGALSPVGEIHPAVSAVYAVGLLAWAIAPTPEGQNMIAALRSSRLGRALAASTGVLCTAGVIALVAPGSGATPLVVNVMDVGQGDAILARTPGGRTVLIDGGTNPAELLAQIGRRMGILEHDLSAAILTRADGERLPGAVAAIERYPPALVVGPPEGSTSAQYQRWQAIGASRSPVQIESGTTIALDSDVMIELIPTPSVPAVTENGPPQRTLAVRIIHGETSVLIAPSITADAGRALLHSGWPLRSDVLLVPRHGATAGLDPALLAAIEPRVAVISVGAGNRQDLPTTLTLDALRDVSLFRTDLNGTVELRSDGHSLTVVPERTRI
jgi:competence protein ComEC